MPQGAADAAIARVADIAATGPDVASRMAALADLADTIGAPVTAVELWFQLWRRNHADNSIARALEACEQMSSAYQALAFLTSHADPHAGDPGITKTGLRIARRVNAELQATEPTLDPELVLAARNLFVWHIATEAPVAGAKRLLQGLLKKMKEADVAGDVHGAIAHGEAALSIDPGNTFPLKVMARLYRVVGNDAGARQVLRRLVEAEPADMGLSLRYTRSCRAAGRMDDAIETLIENGMRQPGHIELYETLDDCLTDMNAR
jgi:tetratricopeptide (TPR) repeat protein